MSNSNENAKIKSDASNVLQLKRLDRSNKLNILEIWACAVKQNLSSDWVEHECMNGYGLPALRQPCIKSRIITGMEIIRIWKKAKNNTHEQSSTFDVIKVKLTMEGKMEIKDPSMGLSSS